MCVTDKWYQENEDFFFLLQEQFLHVKFLVILCGFARGGCCIFISPGLQDALLSTTNLFWCSAKILLCCSINIENSSTLYVYTSRKPINRGTTFRLAQICQPYLLKLASPKEALDCFKSSSFRQYPSWPAAPGPLRELYTINLLRKNIFI